MLAEALKACGHNIIYSLPQNYNDTSVQTTDESMCYAPSMGNLGEIVTRCQPDIVLFSNWGLAAQAGELDVPIIVDINGSLVLENHHRRHSVLLNDALAKIRALEKADLVIAGSHAQKHYLIAWGLMAGMNPDAFPIEVVPFSLSPRLPAPKPPKDPLAVMAGYNWPWLNGQRALKTVSDEMEALGNGRLMIYSGMPPYNDVLQGEDSTWDATGHLAIANLPRVFLHDPVPFEQLTEVLTRCSFAVDVWQDNLERELAFSSRTVTYLWSGLPVITSAKGHLAELIASYKAGWIVNGNDEPQLSKLVRSLLINHDETAAYGANAQKMVREHLTWDKTIDPLARFCNSPIKRDGRSSLLSKLNRLQDECTRLHTNIADLHRRSDALERENRLLGDVHRKPKGFAVLNSTVLIRRKTRRWLVGWPLLLYLFTITTIGHRLHGLMIWWQRRRQ
jgi:glycosyltransferase involved in cell wall biosynthesis